MYSNTCSIYSDIFLSFKNRIMIKWEIKYFYFKFLNCTSIVYANSLLTEKRFNKT